MTWQRLMWQDRAGLDEVRQGFYETNLRNRRSGATKAMTIRRVILDGLALGGLALAGYGLWWYSEPLACVLVGLGVAIGAEVIGAFPRPRKPD